MHLEGDARPALGTRVLVDFCLPGRANMLRLASTVRRCESSGRVAVHFLTEEASPNAFTRAAVLDFVANHVAGMRRAS